MVKHTISNNQCYVLVSIERFYSLWQSYGKIYGKISAENHNRKPLPMKLWGGVICGVVVLAEDILHFAIRDYQINLSH